MRFVLICGAIGGDWQPLHDVMWWRFKEEIKRCFPGAGVRIYRPWYLPQQREWMLSLGREILSENDTGDDVVVIGHSMGGVIGARIAPHFEKSRVRALATVFSPHTFLGGSFSELLEVEYEALGGIPLVSVSALLDQVVWWGSLLDGSVQVSVWSDHIVYLASSSHVQRLVVEGIAKVLA